MLSEYSTAKEIKESKPEIALLAIGSTEQHGEHLPITTDHIIGKAYAKSIGKQLGAFVLPALPISTCKEHMGSMGSIWINPDTFYHVIQDIVMSLKDQGFKIVVILLSHGGIFIAGSVIREINATNSNIKVIKLDVTQFDQTKEMRDLVECENNLHAGEVETSLMMYLEKDLVKEKLTEDYIPDVPRDYLNYRSILCYTKNGVWGKPSLASAEKGEKIFELIVNKSVEYINDTIGKVAGKGYSPSEGEQGNRDT